MTGTHAQDIKPNIREERLDAESNQRPADKDEQFLFLLVDNPARVLSQEVQFNRARGSVVSRAAITL